MMAGLLQDIAAFGDEFLTVALLFASALLVRSAAIYAGQSWVRTMTRSVTLLLLPVVTYALTSVIAGNIALSLGMIGALSIVRFRNPVKSPLELVIYFLMVSCGITAAVSVGWMVLLTCTAVAVFVIVGWLDRQSRRVHGHSVFTTAASESNSMNTLEVRTTKEVREFLNSAELISFTRSPEGHVYRFASPSRQPLLDLSETLAGDDDVTKLAFSAA